MENKINAEDLQFEDRVKLLKQILNLDTVVISSTYKDEQVTADDVEVFGYKIYLNTDIGVQ